MIMSLLVRVSVDWAISYRSTPEIDLYQFMPYAIGAYIVVVKYRSAKNMVQLEAAGGCMDPAVNTTS